MQQYLDLLKKIKSSGIIKKIELELVPIAFSGIKCVSTCQKGFLW